MSGEEKREYVNEDVEEVRGILTAISDFIKDIQQPIKELIDTLLEPIKGDKFGKEIAAFYKNLIESGMPEDLAKEMTKEYFEKRTKILDIFSNITEMLKGGRGTEWLKTFKKESEEEEEKEAEDQQ